MAPAVVPALPAAECDIQLRTPGSAPASSLGSSCAALFGIRAYCTRVGVVPPAHWDGTIGGRWSMVFSGKPASWSRYTGVT